MIFLINNGGYTIERGYLGKSENYNDIANWAYADLPKVFRRDTSARSFVVKTNMDLKKALSAPNDTMIFVESIMDYDALAPITNSSNKGADLNYGPRGRNTARTCSFVGRKLTESGHAAFRRCHRVGNGHYVTLLLLCRFSTAQEASQ